MSVSVDLTLLVHVRSSQGRETSFRTACTVTGLTALDALDLGYRTWIVEDGTRGCFEDKIEDMKSRITKKGGIFVKSHEVRYGS